MTEKDKLIENFSSGKEPTAANFEEMIQIIFSKKDGITPQITKEGLNLMVSYDLGVTKEILIPISELKGPKGDAGPKGTDGGIGPKGNDGATGPKGTDGAAGPKGLDGPKGTDGLKGPTGANGLGIKSLEFTIEAETNKLLSGKSILTDNSEVPITIKNT